MRRSLIGIVLFASSLTGCSLHGSVSTQTANADSSGGNGVLGSLRPKATPLALERMHQQDELARQQREAQMSAAMAAQQQQLAQSQGFSLNSLGRMLPEVSQDPIAPPAEDIAQSVGAMTGENTNGEQAATQPDNNPAAAFIAAAKGAVASLIPNAQPAAPAVASYTSTYTGSSSVPPPPPGGGGLVPPPPAVTLSTQVVASSSMPPGAYDPNAAPYANPYAWFQQGSPYPPAQYAPPPQYAQPQALEPQAPTRPNGSPFATGGSKASSNDGEDEDQGGKKKVNNFVPIIPSGMNARSAYQQHDELKILWKGALSTAAAQELMNDDKFAAQVNAVNVGIPCEGTRGSLNVSSRVVSSIFKNPPLDKRIVGAVKKLEMDVAQAYYNYLYTYHHYALAQQTVAASKQEMDVAGSQAEQQRAAADLSQAQNTAESAKYDMRSAQSQLAATVGNKAAATIIHHVSGVAPTGELAQAEQSTESAQKPKGVFESIFSFGKKKENNGETSAEAPKVASAENAEKPKRKKHKAKENSNEHSEDLKPAPVEEAQATPRADEETEAASEPHAKGSSPICFELKNVQVTPRKSVLTVAIKNGSGNNFSFSPDYFSISEGNHRLSEAAVRADFDSTMVEPNAEVKGTITIFGRPWNDKLAVVLSDGGKAIQLRH